MEVLLYLTVECDYHIICVSHFQAVSSKHGNVLISPLSAEVVLALAYMGAAGKTAKQIGSALYLPPDREDIKAGFAAILGSLKVRKGQLTGLSASISTVFLKIIIL
jgi:serine protease inhibitor